MQLIFLKNIVTAGTCPMTIPLDKVRFLKAGGANRGSKPSVLAYFTSQSFVTLASFETQEEANAALERLEVEISHRVCSIKPYSAEFISAESWGKSNA
jgi:hypothetical protein